MDGEMLGKTIMAAPFLAEVRMVMLTSLGSRGDARRFADAGFAAYLTKPVRNRELPGVLSFALEDRYWSESENRSILTRYTVREQKSLTVSGARILLVENNITNYEVALGILEKLDLAVETAENGRKSLEALFAGSFDLIFMDVQMPEMDGFEAIRAIRSLPQTSAGRDVPIVAMTAHAMQGDRERCNEAGMDDYLSKPIKPQELIEML